MSQPLNKEPIITLSSKLVWDYFIAFIYIWCLLTWGMSSCLLGLAYKVHAHYLTASFSILPTQACFSTMAHTAQSPPAQLL